MTPPTEDKKTAPRMTERDLTVLQWLFSAEDNRPDFTFSDRDAALKKILEMARSVVSGDTVNVPTEILQNIGTSANAIRNTLSRAKFPAARNHAEYIEDNVNRLLSSSRTAGEK